MCDELEAEGNLVQATNACGLALGLKGVTTNEYTHFVHLLMRKEGTLAPVEVAALINVINHVKADPNGRTIGNELDCQLAVRLSDVNRLADCSAALASIAPNDSSTLMYEWDLAVRQHRFAAASEFIERGQAAGLKGDDVARMQKVTRDAERRYFGMIALSTVGALLLAGCLVYGTLKLLGRRRIATPPPPPAAPAPAS
jgi:hypothetical protein